MILQNYLLENEDYIITRYKNILKNIYLYIVKNTILKDPLGLP